MAKRNRSGQFVKRAKRRSTRRAIRSSSGVVVLDRPRKASRRARRGGGRRRSSGGGGGIVKTARGFISMSMLIGTGAAVLAGGVVGVAKAITIDKIDFFKTNKIAGTIGTVAVSGGIYWLARKFLPKYATFIGIGLLFPVVSSLILPLWQKVAGTVIKGLGSLDAPALPAGGSISQPNFSAARRQTSIVNSN